MATAAPITTNGNETTNDRVRETGPAADERRGLDLQLFADYIRTLADTARLAIDSDEPLLAYNLMYIIAEYTTRIEKLGGDIEVIALAALRAQVRQ